VVGLFASDLTLTSLGVQAKAFGVNGPLRLNGAGGNGAIGKVSSPKAPLHQPGSPDAAPGGGGALVLGETSGLNVAIDNNEILARNIGALAPLTLNNGGGEVVIGGPLEIGYEVVTSKGGCSSAGGIAVSCPSGKRVGGGGRSSGASREELEESRPNGDTGWHCRFDSCPGGFGDWKAWAICLQVQ
jgi:hypothetical protein